MSHPFGDDGLFRVVINDEQQYSIWPAAFTNALGWTDVGVSGSKSVCLAHIEAVWTDMRPLSLRRRMGEASL
jgi:MbtH protein